MKKVSDYCIRKGLEEIQEQDYQETLARVILKKMRQQPLKDLNYSDKQKLISFAMNKGYEYETIRMVLEDIAAGHYQV